MVSPADFSLSQVGCHRIHSIPIKVGVVAPGAIILGLTGFDGCRELIRARRDDYRSR